MHVLDAHDLYRFYHTEDEETFALRGVSMRVARGEIVAVVGPSGSGKSTLLSCLAGLDEPDGGYVVVAGKRVTRRPESVRAAMRADGIGILSQSGNLLEHLTVTQNIRIAQRLSSAHSQQRPEDLLAGDPCRPGSLLSLPSCRPRPRRRSGTSSSPTSRASSRDRSRR